jgi:hypothetical protein
LLVGDLQRSVTQHGDEERPALRGLFQAQDLPRPF